MGSTGSRRTSRRARRRRLRAGLVGGAVLALSLFAPRVQEWRANRDDIRERSARIAALERDRDQLRARLARASTPTALEEQARRLGLIMPGERAWLVDGLPEAP